MADNVSLDFLKRLAIGISAQFGKECEVAIHDLTDPEHTVVFMENGHVTNRQPGDGPSPIVRDTLENPSGKRPDRLAYLTATDDGRVLKSTSIFEYDRKGRVVRIFSINYDISNLVSASEAIESLLGSTQKPDGKEPMIPAHVEDVLDELIMQSFEAGGGKVPARMTREEKKRAIQFLSDSGAFLITKAGDRIAHQFGISKYTMYSYIDKAKGTDEA